MAVSPFRSDPHPATAPGLQLSRSEPLEDWPYLNAEQLMRSRSRRVCMTCHWFRHHGGPDGVPLLTCQWHQGLISHGDHLTHRCPSWTSHRHLAGGWCPEAA
jgi:hypothetical protein